MARIQQAFIKLREQSDLAIVAGMVATLTEAKASPFSDYLEAEAELDRLGRQADQEITETWQVLERLTISYGGELPKWHSQALPYVPRHEKVGTIPRGTIPRPGQASILTNSPQA